MAKEIGLGIISTGKMAQDFAAGLPHARGIRLSAVASRQRETAERFAARFSVPRAYAGIAAMLDDPGVDLVYVASPPAMHCRDTLAALEAGKAVLCEKPFAINAAEAETMIRMAAAKRLFLMEAMWTRCIPAVVRLQELLALNAIGRVNLMVTGGGFMPPYDPKYYLFRPDLGGGAMLDAGVYLVCMSSMVFGPPQHVHATGVISEHGVDEHDAVLLRHNSGAIAALYISMRIKQSPEVLLLGESGRIRLHPPLFRPKGLTLSCDGADDEIIDLPFDGNGYQFEAVEAAACVREGKLESPRMPLHETLQIMHTLDEIRQQLGLVYPMEK